MILLGKWRKGGASLAGVGKSHGLRGDGRGIRREGSEVPIRRLGAYKHKR